MAVFRDQETLRNVPMCFLAFFAFDENTHR
jgi:hypothetical protein